jgi:Xaa-Pro dipeptidase
MTNQNLPSGSSKDLINDEINGRIEKLRSRLKMSGIDAVFIIQNVDLYYFSGTIQQGILFVPADSQPVLFIKRDIDRAISDSPLKEILQIKNIRQVADYITAKGVKLDKAGLELDLLPVNQYRKFQEMFPKTVFSDFSMEIRKQRIVKTPYEIARIKRAGELNCEVFEEIKPFIREGVRELDIAYELEHIARKKGHMGLVRTRAFNQEMFYGHYLSGENGLIVSYVDSPTAGSGQGTYFPQGAGQKRLKSGEPLSIDFVFVHEGYMVDQTRIYCIGQLPAELVAVYGVALEIHEKIRDTAMPGVSCDSLVKQVYGIVEERGLKDIFMGPRGKNVSYIGHGLGLELDELPPLVKGAVDTLDENVVFALEPKFFLPSIGMAGIENTYLMTKKGLLLLTKYPEDIQIV